MRIVAVVQAGSASWLLATVATATGLTADAAPSPLQVIDQIPGPDGGYDYVAIDPQLGRLFVAREHGVMAIDLATRKVTPQLVAADDVAAVLPLPDGRTMLAGSLTGTPRARLFALRLTRLRALCCYPHSFEPLSAAGAG